MGYVILIVEDDPAMGSLLHKVLVRRGYLTHVVTSATEALSIVQSEPVDVVVSDCSMPKMDGFKLLGQLKALRADLPVVLMTSFSDHEQGLRADQEGACTLLSKPLNMDTLLSCIETLLAGKGGPAVQPSGIH